MNRYYYYDWNNNDTLVTMYTAPSMKVADEKFASVFGFNPYKEPTRGPYKKSCIYCSCTLGSKAVFTNFAH